MNMTKSITDAFKCNHCGALYDSEKELLEHQQAAHHADVSDRRPDETSAEETMNQQADAKAKSASR
jgi:DNA-directed RNA polymerase subunit M/transcription elongation factor TFIIS